MPIPENAIVVENLTKYYGKIPAVKNLSFNVKKGQVLCCLGSNGAGKTTTLKMLSGLLKPTNGRVWLYGKEVNVNRSDFRLEYGIVLDEAGVYDKLTALEYLRFFASLLPGCDKDETRIQYFLERFNLWENRNQYLKTFSRGMLKKVLLARALLHNPRILMLDEPTAALDLDSKVEIINIIRGLASKDSAIFICTHDVNLVEDLESDLLCIENGRKIALITREDISAAFENMKKNVITFVDEVNPDIFKSIETTVKDRLTIDGKILILLSENTDPLLDELKKVLQSSNLAIVSTEQKKLTLQEFYRELCKK